MLVLFYTLVCGAFLCRSLPNTCESQEVAAFRVAIKANSRKYYITGQGKSAGVLGNRAKKSGKYTRGRWEALLSFCEYVK
jgi:hypothetical protein